MKILTSIAVILLAVIAWFTWSINARQVHAEEVTAEKQRLADHQVSEQIRQQEYMNAAMACLHDGKPGHTMKYCTDEALKTYPPLHANETLRPDEMGR